MKTSISHLGRLLNTTEQKEIQGGMSCGENTICVASQAALNPNCIPFSIVQTSCGWSCMIPPC